MGNKAAYALWWKNAVIYRLAVPLVTDGPFGPEKVLHNLGPEPVEVGVALGDDVEPGRPMAELLGNRHQEPATTGQPMALAGFGYRWPRLPG